MILSKAIRWSAGLLAASCAACAPLATVNPDGTIAHHYVGYVKVLIPPSYGDAKYIHAVDVTSVGIQVRDGVGVGYFRDQRLAVPLDCRVVVLVRTQAQLDHTVAMLNRTTREGLCATIYRR